MEISGASEPEERNWQRSSGLLGFLEPLEFDVRISKIVTEYSPGTWIQSAVLEGLT